MTAFRTKVKPPSAISVTYSVISQGVFVAKVGWTPQASGFPNSYYVIYRNDEEYDTTASATTYRDTNVAEGTSYNYAVSTVNINETEGVPTSQITLDVPAYPIWQGGWSLSILQNTTASVAIRCSDPKGLPLTFSKVGGTAPSEVTVNAAGSVAVGSTTAGSYTLGIRANNGYLTSDYTASLSVNASIVAPDPPENVVAQPIAQDLALLTWSPPSTQPLPDDYDIRYATTLGGSTTTVAFAGTGTSASISGLAVGNYYFEVRAGIGTNESAWISASPYPVVLTAPPAGATFTIPTGTGTRTFNGSSATTGFDGAPWITSGGIQRVPTGGDVIEFSPGNHGKIVFNQIRGISNSNRITVRGPQTGSTQASISGSGDAFSLTRCRYINIDGECASSSIAAAGPSGYSLKRSIKITGTGTASHIIKFNGSGTSTYDNTRDITLRYLELQGTGTAASESGIATNDQNNDKLAADNANNWQENILIEYCYLHDISNEGMYLGPNVYIAPTTGSPKPLRYVIVRYNALVDIGWEGIQSKKWMKGYPGMGSGGTSGIDNGGTTYSQQINSIHDNLLLRVGQDASHANDNSGLSSLHSECSIYNNWVETCNENGIVCNNESLRGTGTAPTAANTHHIFNNVVIGSGQNSAAGSWAAIKGSNASLSLAGVLQKVYVFSNTVFSNTEDGINVTSGCDPSSFAKNNISVDNGGTDVSAPITTANTTGSSGSIFVDKAGSYGSTNFHLTGEIAASGTIGTDYSSLDKDGISRAGTASRGAYEFA